MSVHQYSVFISYSHKDGTDLAREITARIVADPRGKGITFWKDYDSLHYGKWTRQIEEAIEAVDFLIMVLTPGALASDNCKEEWMYARRKGVCIVPVNGLTDAADFYATFPGWLKKQHVYDLNKQWERFINDLNTTPKETPVPFMAPRLSNLAGYVPRLEILAYVKSLLLERNSGGTATAINLEGGGGFGKTSLAVALCNDDEIISHFDDGILWTTIGQQAGSALAALHKIYRAITNDSDAFIDMEEGQQKIAACLEKRNCLVVLDDIWKATDFKQVTDALGSSTVLTTSRFPHISSDYEVLAVKVDEMKMKESVALLTGHAADSKFNRQAFSHLSVQLGHWPLLLKLARAWISKRVLEGETLDMALAFIQKKYDRKGITAFDHKDEDQRNSSVKKSLEAGLELLRADEKNKLLQLAIFPDDEPIPFQIVGLLWGTDDFDTEELLDILHQSALLDLNLINKTCSIHDVLLQYYSVQSTKEKIADLHTKLISGLGDFTNFTVIYAWKWYVWHLVESGNTAAANHLLQQYEWIESKLFATDVASLLADFEQTEKDESSELIYETLLLSRHILSEQKNQLPSQLWGRLANQTSQPFNVLLQKASTPKIYSWIKPIKSYLSNPGTDLTHIFKGHTQDVLSVLIYQHKIISSSLDGTMRIWDTVSGQCLHILMRRNPETDFVLVYQDQMIANTVDHAIGIWSIESGECLHMFTGHTNSINWLFVHENYLVSASKDNAVRIWDIDRRIFLHSFYKEWNSKFAVLDSEMFTSAPDGTLTSWNIVSGKRIHIFSGHLSFIEEILFSKNKIITVSVDKTIRIWDMHSGKCLHVLNSYIDGISKVLIYKNQVIYSPDKKVLFFHDIDTGERVEDIWEFSPGLNEFLVYEDKLIVRSADETKLEVFDIESGDCIETIEFNLNEPLQNLSISDKLLFCYTKYYKCLTWDLEASKPLPAGIELGQFKDNVYAITWVREGFNRHTRVKAVSDQTLVATSGNGTICIYKRKDWRMAIQPPREGSFDKIQKILLDGNTIITGSVFGCLQKWDVHSGECLQTLQAKGSRVIYLVRFKNTIITASELSISIWDYYSGVLIQTFENVLDGDDHISSLFLSGNKLVIVATDTTLRIMDLSANYRIIQLEGHREKISVACVHNDICYTGSDDTTIKVWDIASRKCLQTLHGHTAKIIFLDIQANTIVSASTDQIRLWDISSGECNLIIEEKIAPKMPQIILYRNKIIGVASGYRGIMIWETKSGKLINTIFSRHRGPIFIHDGKIIWGSLVYQNITIWALETAQYIKIIDAHKHNISTILVQDNKLFSTDKSGLLLVHDLNTFKELLRYTSDLEMQLKLAEGNTIVCEEDLGISILEINAASR